jgi:hypothetical protein
MSAAAALPEVGATAAIPETSVTTAVPVASVTAAVPEASAAVSGSAAVPDASATEYVPVTSYTPMIFEHYRVNPTLCRHGTRQECHMYYPRPMPCWYTHVDDVVIFDTNTQTPFAVFRCQ